MAYITFLAKNREAAVYQLTSNAVIGRSLDCDIFIPDIFMSRQHCRFEQTAQGWRITDTRSKNGVFYNGKRFFRRYLKTGDVIEIGTIAFEFNEGDVPEWESKPAPFGTGRPLTELMDTLFTEGLRAADYVLLKKRQPAWARTADSVSLAEEPEPEPEPEPEYFSEWTELDMEIGVASLPLPEPLRFRRVEEDEAAAASIAGEELEELLPAEARNGGGRKAEPRRAAKWGNGQQSEESNGHVPAVAARAADNSSAVAPSGPRPGWGKTRLFDENEFAVKEETTVRKGPVRRPPGADTALGRAAKAPKKKGRKAIKDGPSWGERLRDVYDTLRATDISEMIEAARARPLFSASMAVTILALCITWYWWSNRVVYHRPGNYNAANYKAARND